MALSSVNLSSLSSVNLAQPNRGLEVTLRDEIEVTRFSPIECVKNKNPSNSGETKERSRSPIVDDPSLSILLETGEAEERSRSPVVYDTSSDEDEKNGKFLGSIIDAAAEPPVQPVSAPQSASSPTAQALDTNEAEDWFASPLLPILTPDDHKKFTDDIGTNLEEAFVKMYDEAHSMVSNKAEMQGQLDKFVAGTCISAAGLTSVVGSDFAAYSKIASDSLQGLMSMDSIDMASEAASAHKEPEEVVVSIETSLDTSAATTADKKRNLSVLCSEEVSDVNLNVLPPVAGGSCPLLRDEGDDVVGKLNEFVNVACISANILINSPEVKRVLDSTNSSVYSCSQMATDSIQNLIMKKNGSVEVCSADGSAALLEKTESIEVLAAADVNAGEGESGANSNSQEGRALGIPSQEIIIIPADPPAVPTNDMDASVLTATFNSIVEKVTTETSTVNEVVSACMCPANRTAGSLNISLMESLQSFTSGPVIDKSLSFIADPDTMASVCLVKGNDSFPSSLQSPTSVAHREAVVDDSRNQSDNAINFVATKIKTDDSTMADEAQELNTRITATTSTDRTTRASDSIPKKKNLQTKERPMIFRSMKTRSRKKRLPLLTKVPSPPQMLPKKPTLLTKTLLQRKSTNLSS